MDFISDSRQSALLNIEFFKEHSSEPKPKSGVSCKETKFDFFCLLKREVTELNRLPKAEVPGRGGGGGGGTIYTAF
jgi:hypothetical protein